MSTHQHVHPDTLSPLGSDSVEQKATAVQSMFDRIAPTYDLLNNCISLGMHHQWKKTACDLLNLKSGDSVLDVCTGTGDLMGLLHEKVKPNGHCIGLDFSQDMLAVARKRFENRTNTRFVQGDAMALPFDDDSFDAAIVSFGLRNVSDVPTAVSEMRRVVKPGGWVVNLDTSPKSKIPGFNFYFSKIMPIVGRLLSQDETAYTYLSQSTQGFYTPEQLKTIFSDVGLQQVIVKPLALGSVSIQAGQKA